MKSISRRNFILGCSSGLSLGVLSILSSAQAQVLPLGFWKAAMQVPPNVRITQCVAKTAVLDTSFKVRTTQVVSKTAFLDNTFKVRATQVVAKVAVKTT